ncbi:glycosyltransferase family 92 protein [Frateuria aurantia]
MRFGLTICAIFKDEAAYLREWLDFHLLMGVEHFYLYDNGSLDQSQEAVAPYVAKGQVTLYAWPRRPGQLEAYNHCVFTHRHDCDWMACIDIDEFLFSPQARPLPEVLAAYADHPGVGVNWVMFGSSGHREKPVGGVLENYRRRGPLDAEVAYPGLRRPDGKGYRPENSHIKSIVRPDRVAQFTNPHFAHYAEDAQAVTEAGQLLTGPFSDSVSVDVLRINHYWSKSEEEARRKFARGFADGHGAREWVEFAMHEQVHNSVADDSILKVTVALSRAAGVQPLGRLQVDGRGLWHCHDAAFDPSAAEHGEAMPAEPAPAATVLSEEPIPAADPAALIVAQDRMAIMDLAGADLGAGASVLLLGRDLEGVLQALADRGCSVDVLEHNLARAVALAKRTAACSGVRVIHSGLAALAFEPHYDAVILLGLPEYVATLGLDADGMNGWLARLKPALAEYGRLLIWLPNRLKLPGVSSGEDIRHQGDHVLRDRFGRREMQRALSNGRWTSAPAYAVFEDADTRPELAIHESLLVADTQQGYELLAATRGAASLERRVFLQLAGLADESALVGLADSYLWVASREEIASNPEPVLWRRLVDARWPGLRRIEDGHGGNGMDWEVRVQRLLPSAEMPVLLGQAVEPDFTTRLSSPSGNLLVALRQAAAARQLDKLQALLRQWMALVRGAVGSEGNLPGCWLDALPAHIFHEDGRGWSFSVGHWRYRDPVEPDLPLYLGLWALADDPMVSSLVKGSDRIKTMLWLCAEAGLVATEKWLSASYKLQALLSPAAPGDGKPAVPDFARYLGQPADKKPLSYPEHMALRVLDHKMLDLSHARVEQAFQGLPELVVVVLAFGSQPAQLLVTLKGLQASQYRGPVQLVILSDQGAPLEHHRIHWITVPEGGWHKPLQQWLAGRGEQWLMFVNSGDCLEPATLLLLAERMASQPAVKAIYFDEDQRHETASKDPVLKPDFNLDMLRSYPYLGRGIAIHLPTCLELGGLHPAYGEVSVHELILRIFERHGSAAIGHIAEIQYHAALPFPKWLTRPTVLGVWAGAVGAHLRRLGIPHTLLSGALPGMNQVRYDYDQKPLVSIIIPTRDQLHLINGLIDSLMQRTAYTHYELLIVDNDSQDPATCRYLDGLARLGSSRIRVLRYPHPFNYSAMNNFAAREARGEYLLLLNNDTAILHAEWLDAMLNHARRPEVGIVGAKLHYPDGRIQHAGVILGLRGVAEHPFIGDAEKAGGYMHRLQIDQNYSAVTAACLMIRTSVYWQVGGLDEKAFKVSYNDVDLCLKVREAGHLIVWTPYARVLHHGSVSQKQVDKQTAEAKKLRFQGERDAMEIRWMPQLANDPAYNRNLLLRGKGFELDNGRGNSWQPFSQPLLPRIICHPADATGCGHYRVRQPFAAMRREGVAEGQVSEQLFLAIALERDQVRSLILQRQHTEPQREAMAAYRRLSNTFMVYELDDYMLNLPVKSAHRKHMPKDLSKSLRAAVALTDRFVVSTECMADEFGYMHSDIRVVNNRLPVEWWTGLRSERRVGARPRVGWGGGASHTGDLEMIGDVVRELADEVDWIFFGMCPEKLRPYVKEFHGGVPIESYPSKLASLNLDLALAPLEDNLFNACKSNLRLLEYGACGFPVICSDLVTYRGELPVTRVKNRFKDWVGAIRMHLADLDATEQAGDALREAVLKDWMLSGDHVMAWRDAWLPS